MDCKVGSKELSLEAIQSPPGGGGGGDTKGSNQGDSSVHEKKQVGPGIE